MEVGVDVSLLCDLALQHDGFAIVARARNAAAVSLCHLGAGGRHQGFRRNSVHGFARFARVLAQDAVDAVRNIAGDVLARWDTLA